MVGNEEPRDRGPPDISSMDIAPSAQKRPIYRDCDEVLHSLKAKRVSEDSNPISASVQHSYSHPSLAKEREYSQCDDGPYIVHVSKVLPDPAASTSIRAIKIGQLLVCNGIKDIKSDGIKRIGRNRVSIEFSSFNAANDFLKNPILQSNNLIGTIPTYNFSRMGLVRGVPTDLSMEEFALSIVVPNGCTVLKARRLNRKNRSERGVEWIPTNTVVLTFQGQKLPERVFSFHSSLPVENYQLPTIQCLKCCRFGHVRDQCRSAPRCFRCAQSHPGDECSVLESSSTCLFCSRPHFATFKNCSEHVRQQNIKNIMSKESISFQEASLRFPAKSRGSYADVTAEAHISPSPSFPSQDSGLSPSPAPTSYKKSVFRSPRPRSPLARGYDRAAHQEIVNTPTSVSPNGCLLNFNQSDDNIIDILISLLVNILSKYDDSFSLPSNVAEKLFKISSLFHKHGPSPYSSMEQPISTP